MRILVTLIVAIVMLSGCSQKFKKKVGVITSGPDEYQISTQKPLEVPPHYNLPAPQ